MRGSRVSHIVALKAGLHDYHVALELSEVMSDLTSNKLRFFSSVKCGINSVQLRLGLS